MFILFAPPVYDELDHSYYPSLPLPLYRLLSTSHLGFVRWAKEAVCCHRPHPRALAASEFG